ncbi:sigma-w pathway protein ysdB [Aquibacillus salsiterrae]|uniref:Sigma-w pathway protein ysdB n=1 Tax=Aquibacillus salsiterrae TaxID=2950439 RepID=A0A9X3WE18_9BACI|nr:sigma-w pathway protein ysdB [Aquibacillus salsiterrae]MDC3415724.1 sigma-w pathway protein ysdB [Aquibacillus salsiterrae]
MIVLIFRLLLIIAIIFLLYTAYQYLINPKRKLELAKDRKEFFLLDDPETIKKNFLLTYKGILFEGEKYLGTTEQSFDVITIIVHTHNPSSLKGLERNDLYFLEKEILIRYPNAKIEWKYPINRLLILDEH